MFAVDTVVKTLGQKYLQAYSNLMSLTQDELLRKQEAHFQSLKRGLQGTRLYKDLRLSHIHNYEEFVEHVPARPYEDYAPYVDMVIAGHGNILFKDRVRDCGLTSGTSGKDSKRIPYNERMIKMFLKSQKRVASRLTTLEPGFNPLKAGRLTFGSDPILYTHNGVRFGYISGILSTRVPKSLQQSTFPSTEVLAITNWDKKIQMLIDEVINEDIQMVSGIPTYIISIFEAVLAKTGRKEIREIWPNLQIFVYAATPIKQYADRINRLVGHEINYYGLYAATEAAIGLPYSKYENGRQLYFLNPDLLYSFTEVDGDKRTRGLHEIEMNRAYYLNIGTPNGFVHYAMKDVIAFHQEGDDLVFEFVGRKSTGMNLAAEKVLDDEILNCFLATKNRTNIDLRHFFLSPGTRDGKTAYQWTIFTPAKSEICAEDLASIFDEEMQKINLDYKDCREVGVLASSVVRIVSAEFLQKYFEENRSKGQFKLKTTFETADEYTTFMNQHVHEKSEGTLQ